MFRSIFKKFPSVCVCGHSLGEKSANGHYGNQDAGNEEQNQTYSTVFGMLLLFLFLFQ